MHHELIKSKPLSIYIDDCENIHDSLYIKNKIKKIFNPEMITICDNYKEAEVIVSTGFFNLEYKGKVFLLSNVFDEMCWQEFLSFLINTML